MPEPVEPFPRDVVVVGGCGHVGLPLAIAFADRGANVGIYDTSAQAVELVNSARLPFDEPGAAPVLSRAVAEGRLIASTDPAIVGTAANVVVVIGTPVDEHLNPDQTAIPRALGVCSGYFRDGQLLVLRSTVYPGVTALVEKMVARLGVDMQVAFCPERIAEGKAMTELFELPQIVASRTARGLERASRLFSMLTPELVPMTVEEAELAKLFTNAWRYIKFAAANQFYLIASDLGLDYERIRRGLIRDYPRARDLARAGFAAGPCLLKDTMQLSAFTPDHFPMGQAAMQVNEGLPNYIVDTLNSRRPLSGRTVGILGMAFKGESDDPRASLSYKLRKLAAFKGARVLCTDPYIHDESFVPLDRVLKEAELLVIAAPHHAYKHLDLKDREVVDIWGVTGPIRL